MLLLALARPAIPGHRTIVAAHSCTHNASITNITRHTFDLPLPSSTTTYTYHCSASLIILILMQYNRPLLWPFAFASRRPPLATPSLNATQKITAYSRALKMIVATGC